MAYEIKLDIFEGPLDLLLHLIKKNKIDIYNIPIALITDQYLQYIEVMRSLNLDLAGEYLVLASTLIHIKSRFLLPLEEEDEVEEEDPRSELVKQLLEYQSYKEAALHLDGRLLLDRDVFKRSPAVEAHKEIDEREINQDINIELSLFDLLKAFRKILSNAADQTLLEIDGERMSLSDRINDIMERLSQSKFLLFTDVIEKCAGKRGIIYTFLAVLELMKLRMIRVYQTGPLGVIRIYLAAEQEERENYYS